MRCSSTLASAICRQRSARPRSEPAGSYVGRQVGMNGIRGYMPEQRASHVMARHVSVVQATQLK